MIATVMLPDWMAYTTGVLILVTLSLTVLRFVFGWWKGGTENVVTDMQKAGELPTRTQVEAIRNDIADIKTQAAKIEFLETRQIQLASKIDNGIKDRLDKVEDAQVVMGLKLDGISTDLAGLTGMMKLHLRNKVT